MEVRTTGVPVIGEKELRRAAEILRRYKQGRQNLERRIIADEDWWKLRQWRQFADKGNPNDDRPASGWLFNVIMGKHADAIAAYPGPNIRPREPDDRMEAQMLSSILPCILEQNDFEEVYSDTCWQKMKQGTGVWGVYWDQEKLGGLGDISIRPVNVLNLVWEPGVTDIQKSQNVFYLELEDNETLLAAYPQLAGKLGGSSGLLARYRTDDAVDLSEKTLVMDWYYKKRVEGRTVLHYCKYVGQTVLYATENDTFVPSVTREEVDERGERTLVQVPVRGPACERGLYDDGEYPFIFDRLFPIEGSICGYGYIDIGKGAQEQIDRMDQAIVKNTIMSATPRWFRRADGSVNEQEYADWTKPFVHVDGNLGQDSLQQVQVRTLPAVCAGAEQQDRGAQVDDRQHGRDERAGLVGRDGGLGHRGAAGGLGPQLARVDAVGLPGLRADDPDGHRAHPAVLRSAAEIPHSGRGRGGGIRVLLQCASQGAKPRRGRAAAHAGL